jgi:hypothetical protein
MSKTALTLEEQFRLDEMIDASVVSRYDGDLQQLGPDQDGAINYVPLDVEGVSDLLTALWGGLLSPGTITAALIRLTQDGAEHWRHALCDEEDAEEEFRRACDLDHEIECAEEHLAALTQKRGR